MGPGVGRPHCPPVVAWAQSQRRGMAAKNRGRPCGPFSHWPSTCLVEALPKVPGGSEAQISRRRRGWGVGRQAWTAAACSGKSCKGGAQRVTATLDRAGTPPPQGQGQEPTLPEHLPSGSS